MRRVFSIILFAGIVVSKAHAGQLDVLVGGEPDLDACAEMARVKSLEPTPGNGLNVRRGPGLEYGVIDLLPPHEPIVVCDYRFGPDWVGIVYGANLREECGIGSPIPASTSYEGPCKSGWVARNFLIFGE